MNDYQKQLYVDLVTLTQSNEAFYYQDFVLDDKTYRIFNYRLASYTDFQLPSALECRGIMFEMSVGMGGAIHAVRLASLPMEKFFNLNENPSTIGLDLSTVVDVQEKADGSLMSTYMHDGHLRLKSKGSLFSDQAIAAMKWLDTQPKFKNCLWVLANENYTVNLEWCSPEHRIVLGYLEPTLKVMNARDNPSGEYVDFDETFYGHTVEHLIVGDPVGFVESIPSMVNVEGFVLLLKSGQRVKVKCDWYLALHHAKDSVNNPRRLFECILSEGIDDVRSMFYDDPVAIMMIDQMQVKVDHLYNHLVKTVEGYYSANKHLSKKDYAIKGKQELTPFHFGPAMAKYDRPDEDKPFRLSGEHVDYKGYLKSKWKELGLKDTSQDKGVE